MREAIKFAGPTAHRRVRPSAGVCLVCSQTAQSGRPRVPGAKVCPKRSGWPPIKLRQGHGDLWFAMESECRVRIHWPCHAILTCSCLPGSGDLWFTMDSVRGVRIHCACGAIMKCTKLSASKLPFFFCFVAFAACSRHPVFYNGFWPAVIWQVTAHWKIQWILNFGAESPQYMKRLCRDTIWQVTIHCKTQCVLNVEAESLEYTRWSWLPACRVASSKWEKMVVGMFLVDIGFAIARVMIHWKTQWIMASESESIVFYRSPWLHHGDLQNTMDSDAVARIPCVVQWIVNSPSSHIDVGLQANFLFLFRIVTFATYFAFIFQKMSQLNRFFIKSKIPLRISFYPFLLLNFL